MSGLAVKGMLELLKPENTKQNSTGIRVLVGNITPHDRNRAVRCLFTKVLLQKGQETRHVTWFWVGFWSLGLSLWSFNVLLVSV